MLITRLDQVTQEITELGELKLLARDAQAFHTRATQLHEISMRIEIVVSIAQEFQRRGIAVQFDRSRLTSISKQLSLIFAAYREDPQSIVAATEQRYTFWEPLKTLPNEIHAALLQAWSEYVRSVLPRQQTELLETLGKVPGFNERIKQITRLDREAALLGRQLPQTPEEIDRIAAIASELKTTWAQLPTEGIPADVRDFLTAAVEGNARLAQLTGPVVEWLQFNNLVDSVRISLKA